MARPSRPVAMDRAGRTPKPDNGLEALKALRNELSAHTPKERSQPSEASRPPTDAKPAAPDDAGYLRAALRGVTPIKGEPRAELDHVKPPPLPRPRPRESEPAPAPASLVNPGPGSGPALFRAMMQDVTPLRDTHRIEPMSAHSRNHPLHLHQGDAGDITAQPPLLPPNPDQLSPEALFLYANRGTRPLDDRNRAHIEPDAPSAEPVKRCEDEQATLRDAMELPMSFEDRLDAGDEAAFLRHGLPRRVLTDLRRGRWVLQGELDLHGLNRDEARMALGGFLGASVQRGRRCVRVIHGKGLGSPGRVSILKQLSRNWLAQREEILAFCQAGPNQGGSGALMVLLKAPNAANR